MTYLSYHIPKIKRISNNIPNIIKNLENILKKNKIKPSYIGKGYYNSILPPMLNDTFLKNPKWYTPYTPYQSEISQGRLEMLHNYQYMISELTNMDIANASLLDECNSACESINMAYHYHKGKKQNLLIHSGLHPQVINSLKLKSECMNIKYNIFDDINEISPDLISDSFGLIVQNPTTTGYLLNLDDYNKENLTTICGVDPLSLFKIKPPGDYNFNIVYGSINRLGLGLSYGGPHAGFLTCDKEYLRLMPGRIVAKAFDKYNNEGYRLALQTREQHIKMDRALSNICTAQSLPAVIATAYIMYHGKQGMINMADNIHNSTKEVYSNFNNYNTDINTTFFDTLNINFDCDETFHSIRTKLNKENISFYEDHKNNIGLSIDETHDKNNFGENIVNNEYNEYSAIPKEYLRNNDFLNDNIFSGLSELELTRYFHKLVDKDYSLVNGMIPLGSCTMKHTTPWSMSLFSNPNLNIHPYASKNDTKGYQIMFDDIKERLAKLIGLPVWFLQSQSGAMGEYSALYTIRKFYENKNEERNTILIPDNAHGTNFASASLAGFKIKKLKTIEGEICLDNLEKLINDNVAGIMITYPSTFGLFDENINSVIELVKNNGSKVYLDGANMNALVGNIKLSDLNVDVCHLNLHKTFSIPHGGGGPGMGPIGLTKELEPFLPKDPLEGPCISGSKYGSGALCSIVWSYLNLLEDDIKICTDKAIENSNYLKDNLKDDFKILFTDNKKCTHEFLLDITEFSKKGINEEHIAKRLMDYGFHAPTMSWPIKGVLMIEPTESEPIEELDRFINSMKSIKKEIEEYSEENNPLINAPHTQRDLLDWSYPYSVENGCYPLGFTNDKFWPRINKLNNVESDKNLMKSKNI